jgi:hypothetical protein
MLPPFIIEQIRKREEERRQHEQRPTLELPLPAPPSRKRPVSSEQTPEEDRDRGVVILDLLG